ncbi:hypothetical protein LSH36_400g00019 [Paralvinella palmiformis]|uniref:C1q domain-containing protein n=1 Tax=Paralvinella palmiformis TaxID=53620 RepID=A0AAD9N1A0_9ANNE|nr:hypothetical protein LSH36_400g00019 [Paralvinella palmiformis]
MSSSEDPNNDYLEIVSTRPASRVEDGAYTGLDISTADPVMPVLPPISNSGDSDKSGRCFVNTSCAIGLVVTLTVLLLANTAAVCYLLYRVETKETSSDCSTSLIQHYSILLPPGVNVVFYAMVGAYSGLVDEHRIIKFDDVQLNIGDAYNIDSGRFKAPTDGIYSISYEALTSDQCNDDYMCVSLFMDDEIVSISCGEYATSAGTSVSLELAAGRQVWVSIHHNAPCHAIYGGTGFFNKFSGHLVSEISPS